MDIFAAFRAAANLEKAVPMKKYMRNQFPFLGLQTPERKQLSREFLKSKIELPPDWDFVFQCWSQPEREFQYLAKDYLAKIVSKLTGDDVVCLRDLALQKAWWDTIDGIDVIIGDIALRYPEVNKTLLKWSADDNFWLRRIAIDHQLGRKEKTDPVLLEQIIINNLGQQEFFINKAVGWSLRDYSKINPHWVKEFIARHKDTMAPLSIREGSKYI